MNNHPGTAPKKHSPKKLWRLFTSTFTLSAFTFGGGYVIIPLMRKKFVEQLHWLEEEEMLDLTAIAQATPGALAVNAAILIGYRVAGIIGALVTVLGTVLPPLAPEQLSRQPRPASDGGGRRRRHFRCCRQYGK